MFSRVLGVGVVGIWLSSCASDAVPGSGAGSASAGAPSAGQAGSAMSGGGTRSSMGGTSASSGSGGGGVGGASGSSSGGAAQAGASAGGASAGGASAGGTSAGGASAGTGAASAGMAGAGGAGDQPSCLPDNSGSITMTLSGSVPFNESRGNDYGCLNHFSNATSGAGLLLRVDNPEPKPYGVVFVDLPKLTPGDVGNIPFDMLTFAVTPGGLWSDPDAATPNTKRCTFNVTANQALVDKPGQYRVAAAISCSGALPGLPGAMTLTKLQFVTLMTPAP